MREKREIHKATFNKKLYTDICDAYKTKYGVELSQKFNVMFFSNYVKPIIRDLVDCVSYEQFSYFSSSTYISKVDNDAIVYYYFKRRKQTKIYSDELIQLIIQRVLKTVIFEAEIEYLTDRINLKGKLDKDTYIDDLYLPDNMLMQFDAIISKKGKNIHDATIVDFIDATETIRNSETENKDLLPYFERFTEVLKLNPFNEGEITIRDYKALLEQFSLSIKLLQAEKNNLEVAIENKKQEIRNLKGRKEELSEHISHLKKVIRLSRKKIGKENGNDE